MQKAAVPIIAVEEEEEMSRGTHWMLGLSLKTK